LLGAGDIPTRFSCFLRGDRFVGVVCFVQLSTTDSFVPPPFLVFSFPCLLPFPRPARCFNLDKNSLASSANFLRVLEGDEPFTLTSSSSSSLTETAEDLLEVL